MTVVQTRTFHLDALRNDIAAAVLSHTYSYEHGECVCGFIGQPWEQANHIAEKALEA